MVSLVSPAGFPKFPISEGAASGSLPPCSTFGAGTDPVQPVSPAAWKGHWIATATAICGRTAPPAVSQPRREAADRVGRAFERLLIRAVLVDIGRARSRSLFEHRAVKARHRLVRKRAAPLAAAYGSGPWIMMLADVIQKVEYPLDLDHIYVR